MADQHPLRPLNEDEIRRAATALRDAGHVGDDHRFAAVTLAEPPKQELLAWRSGEPWPRRAVAQVVDRSTGDSCTGVVDLTTGDVVSWQRDGGHHMVLFEELFEAIAIVKGDPRWQDALRKRGVTDFEAVQCDPWPAGNFDRPGEDGRRLTRVLSYVRHHEHDNGYAHPIEGVVATVDTVAREVVDVEDHGVVPVPEECANYDAESAGPTRTDLAPLDIVQPEGVSFEVDGHEIRWQKWRLRVSMHPTDGLVLHTVTYRDGDRERPILHRAGLGEMVVPYGSPSPGQYWKNAFDSGELGLGRYPLLNSLELGCDCLGVIRYLDVTQSTEDGDAQVVPNAICVHEEDFGILWKHFDLETFSAEVRRKRRLVISSIHTAGNYEYGFYWYLYQDGVIEMEVKLTGIVQTAALPPGQTDPHAELVAPGLAAPHHQHLFCFRLDLDVDGPANSVYEIDAEPVPRGEDNPWGNAFVARETLLGSEAEARRTTDAGRSRHWLVVNPSVRNRIGRPVGYRLLPQSTPTLLAPPDTRIHERAAFAGHNLWVTPHHDRELRAAGLPNLHRGGAGLPEFTRGDRSLADTDVVVWYTFGVTHVARPEDWPVMPVERAGFTLQPFGFFDSNPALDVAPSGGGHCAS